MKQTNVSLRQRQLKTGRISLYLDYYPPIYHPDTGKKTRREYLGLYLYIDPKNAAERKHNKEIFPLAENIRSKRFFDIKHQQYGLLTHVNKHKTLYEFFTELVKKKYTSRGNYENWKSAFYYLRSYFDQDMNLSDLTLDHLEGFKEYLLGLDLKQNTKNSYFSKVKAGLKEAYRRSLIKDDLSAKIRGIKSEEVQIEFVTLDELKRLAKAECEIPILKKAFLFSALTGLRFSDCKALTWQNLEGNDEAGYLIRFKQKKTKSYQTLPISKTARKLLGKRKDDEEQILLGLKYSDFNNKKMRQWIKDAGINKRITFHCARHSFATIQLTLGTDIYTVSKMLGHKNIKNTQVYAKVVDDLKIKAMDKLNDVDL